MENQLDCIFKFDAEDSHEVLLRLLLNNKLQVNKYAFSGGQDTKEKQMMYGANLEVQKIFKS